MDNEAHRDDTECKGGHSILLNTGISGEVSTACLYDLPSLFNSLLKSIEQGDLEKRIVALEKVARAKK